MGDGHRHDPHFRRPLPLRLQAAGKVLGLYDVRHRRRRPADHGAGLFDDPHGVRTVFQALLIRRAVAWRVRQLRGQRQGPQPPRRDPQRHAVRLFPVHHRLQRHVRLGRGEGQKGGAQGHRRGLSDHNPADGLPDLHAVQLYECL